MSVGFVHQQQHPQERRPPAPDGRVVVSRLARGRGVVSRPAMSLKLVLQGEERYEAEGRSHALRPGHIMLVEAGADMPLTIPDAGETVGMCIFLPAFAAERSEDVLSAGPLVLPLLDHPLGAWLSRVAPRVAARPELGERAAPQLLASARLGLNRFVDEAATRMDLLSAGKLATRIERLRRVELARDYLHAVRDRPVSLAELSRIAGMSAFHLARSFREAHGAPPAAYHRALRMDDAARELARGGVSSAQLAVRYGFADQAAFTRAFSRRHGHPPGRRR